MAADTLPFTQRDFVHSIVLADAATWAATGSFPLAAWQTGRNTTTGAEKTGPGQWQDLPYNGGIPQVIVSADKTFAMADGNTEQYHPVADNNARTFTLPSNASVAYPIGTCIKITNMAAADLSLAITTDTMFAADTGTATGGTIPQFNFIIAQKETATSWLLSGSAGTTFA